MTEIGRMDCKRYLLSILKDIIKEVGAHLYTEYENPVYANERLVAVHFKEGGVKKIMLPKACKKVIDVFSGKVVAENTSEFTYTFKTPDTVMFEINQ